MTYRNNKGLWLGAVTLASALAGACGSLASVTQDATTMVAQAVDATTDSSDAVEVSSLMHGLNALRSDAVEGFHCDASPDVTTVTVCGKSLPATVHLEWTECAPPGRPGGGGGGHEGGEHGGPGAPPPPPPPGGSQTGSGTTPSAMPPAGGPEGGKGGPRFGPSSGKVDITYTYTAAEDCSGTVTQDQAVTFEVSRTDADGAVSTVKGTSSSSAELIADAPPQQKATQADVTRTLTDASGTVVSSVHLNGSLSTDFSSDTPPVRTLNGSYTEEFLDGTTGTVTLANLVRPPRNVCPWPISGTLTRGSSDGTTHELVFGPDCGTATLDGTAVDLPSHGPGGHGGPGGGEGRR